MNKSGKTLSISILGLGLLLSGCTGGGNNIIVPELNEFEGITFSDASFDYDGEAHSIYVSGAPSFASISYYNNNKVAPGEYNVIATITADNYVTLRLDATMTIVDVQKEFENLVFEGAEFDYDGAVHGIYVQNVPSFASVSYSNNNKVDPGTYTVRATVSATGYKPKTLTATLKINALKFEGIYFYDHEFNYDGNYHSIYVEGAPSYATVTYTNNNQREIGQYNVTARITAKGHETLVLTAKMNIGKFFLDYEFPDRVLFYDGTDQRIKFEYDNLPYDSDIAYTVDGVSVSEMTVKELGVHTATVTLTNERYKYVPKVFTATIKVVEQNVGTVDASKTPFRITEDLKYQELRSKILEGNFTLRTVVSDDYFYPDDTTKSSIYRIFEDYFDNNEYFSYESVLQRSESIYYQEDSIVKHAKIVGDKTLHAEFVDGLFQKNFTNYMGAENFEENYVARIGLKAMAYLSEKEDGGFAPGKEGGYTTTFGDFYIDTENNVFVCETRNHYYHPEYDHDEVCTYYLYNIGNTKINMIDEFDVANYDEDLYEFYDVIINGVRYFSHFASITYDSIDVLYLEKKAYKVLPVVFTVTVTEITYEYYDKYYGLDLTGYELDLYCNDEGDYQGEYEELGFLKYYRDVYNHFERFGGKVKYYGEW